MNTTASEKLTTPAPKIAGAHHTAFRCRDAEETRKFYEDVLGMKLAAALAFDKDPSGADRPFMHLFFEMTDKTYLAFFDLPHTVNDDMFKTKDGMEDWHYAMEVESKDELEAFKKRLDEAGVPNFGTIDHHFCHSMYFFDPNGLALEFTYRDKKHDEILADEAKSAHDIMREWTAKTAPIKEERLGRKV